MPVPPSASPTLRARDFARPLLAPVLWLFLVPVIGLVFTQYGTARIDAEMLSGIEANIARSTDLTAEKRSELVSFVGQHPASEACVSRDPALEDYRNDVCGAGDEIWQFVQARRVSLVALGLGVLAVLGAIGLGLVAFASPNAQHWSFVAGWRGLTVVGAAEVLLQGALAVWLSFWVTALLFERYFGRLIILVAVGAGAAAWIAIRAIFRRPPESEPFSAEPIGEAEAPVLWARIRELAARLGTEPPAHVVAGIDDNFFVTEAGLPLADQRLEGRALYVSLPLLRVLEPSEADAVFTHELAHFKGGDTQARARLGPKLVRYDAYLGELAEGGMTRPVFFLMRMFRVIFAIALSKDQRERELAADRAAAQLTSPDDVGRSLIKVTAYSSFRAHTERSLFSQQRRHTAELGLRERIDQGLPGHVASAGFTEQLKQTRTPHPFDSHPPLDERIQNVRSQVRFEDAAALGQSRPARTWADEVTTALAIEQRLWAAYEAEFRRLHEGSLPFRYLPATEEERAVVERAFPDRAFARKKGGEVRITHVGIELPEATPPLIRFEDVTHAEVLNASFQNALKITHRVSAGGTTTTKLNLRQLGAAANDCKDAFGRYWGRSQVARQFLADQQQEESAPESPPAAIAGG